MYLDFNIVQRSIENAYIVAKNYSGIRRTYGEGTDIKQLITYNLKRFYTYGMKNPKEALVAQKLAKSKISARFLDVKPKRKGLRKVYIPTLAEVLANIYRNNKMNKIIEILLSENPELAQLKREFDRRISLLV